MPRSRFDQIVALAVTLLATHDWERSIKGCTNWLLTHQLRHLHSLIGDASQSVTIVSCRIPSIFKEKQKNKLSNIIMPNLFENITVVYCYCCSNKSNQELWMSFKIVLSIRSLLNVTSQRETRITSSAGRAGANNWP